MKRILGMAVAIAGVLAYSSAAFATTVVFNTSGAGISWSKSGDANAAIPGPPTNGGPCTPGLASIGYPVADPLINCFRYQFAPGSSVTVDITGSAVTVLGGTINVNAVTPILYGTAVLTTIATTTMAAGGTGTLSGDTITWLTPSNVSTAGTINCAGPNCAAISHPGFAIPLQPYFSALTNTTPVTALNLGTWNLDALHLAILGSTIAVTTWSNDALNPNRRAQAYTFGATGLGQPAPEPGTAALMLLGLGALALRSRKA